MRVDVKGSTLLFDTGRYAHLADGAVFSRFGDTTMLTTVVSDGTYKEGTDFMPLSVEFR